MEEKIINMNQFLGAAQGDQEHMLGKFLYFSLANLLVDKDELSSLCESMGIPYTGSTRLSLGDAFRSATGDIRERVPVTVDGETNIYLAYCRDNKRTAGVFSRELVKETLNRETNRYEKLANISCGKNDGMFRCDNLVLDDAVDVQVTMQRFTLPRDLYHGKGALEALKSFEGKKAIICVGGGSMKRFGFLDKAEAYLKEAGMEVKLFEGIEPDPSVETVMKGAAAMAEFEPDWIVAIGGGSPIDAAKAMWIKYEYPDITFEDMCKVFGIPKLRKKAHFCAISSTSGTATEVTAFSIITDYEKGIKYPIADFEITPDVAIVDPELAETMPQKLVAHTGMDAMTHAIEAYVSTANSDFTDPLALHAIEMIQHDLIDSYNGDMAKRDAMHNAQCLAGMAFSNALLGIVHSMAHKTGAAFADYGAHIIHGAANAMYLPKVIAFNAKDEAAKERYGVIADFMKLGGETLDEKVELLIKYLRGMNDDLNIPHCIKNYGADSYPTEQGFVPEEVFLERLPEIAANAILDACTGSNPRQPSQEEMEKLLKCCYYDTEVDF